MTSAELTIFVTTAPGLEALTAHEIAGLGLAVVDTTPGGLTVHGTAEQLVTLLLGLRTASRVAVRLGQFRARTFAELERHAARIRWADVLSAGSRVHFRVTSKKSRLYHETAIAERLYRAAAAAVPDLAAVGAAADAAALEHDVGRLPGVQRIIVRIFRDQVILSADAAGAGLHRRGYRLATAKAPLRETLAAAMLLGSGWSAALPLHDPLAGSGTIVIEAALLARRIAPGVARRFAVEQWPLLRHCDVAALRTAMRQAELPAGVALPALRGSDRDAGAVADARANAERAGVAESVDFAVEPVSALASDSGRGWIVTNLPYGIRIGDTTALRNLYATLGRSVANRRPEWSLALLSASAMLVGHVGLPLEAAWRSQNGGIDVTLWRSR